MRAHLSALTFCALGALTACGARTTLREPAEESGEGGGGAASGTGATGGFGGGGASAGGGGGEGGRGGSPVEACDFLKVTGEPRSVAPLDALLPVVRPRLVSAAGGAALAFGRFVTPQPPAQIAHVAWSAWDTWPDVLPAPVHTAAGGGQLFEATSTGADTFALVLPIPSPLGPPFVDSRLAPAVAAGVEYQPAPPGFALGPLVEVRHLALAAGGGSFLTARELSGGAPYRYLELALSTDVAPTANLYNLGCGNGPLVAGIAALPGGFLVAHSSGRGPFECGLDDGIPGPPRDLQLERVSADGAVEYTYVHEGEDPIRWVAATPRSDGAWVVWQEDGSTAIAPPEMKILRVDAEGLPVGAPQTIPETFATYGPSGATAMGDAIAVGWGEFAESPLIRVSVRDAVGASIEEIVAGGVDLGALNGGELSLLASPDARELLVAFPFTGDVGTTVGVARLGCATAELR